MKDFEKQLTSMTKPEIGKLKHEEMLAEEIINSKDKIVVSWWWISVPLYVIAALWMKSIFAPQTTLMANIHEFVQMQPFMTILFFVLLPVIIIFITCVNIRKLYILSGCPGITGFFISVWYNILIIICAFIILILNLL